MNWFDWWVGNGNILFTVGNAFPVEGCEKAHQNRYLKAGFGWLTYTHKNIYVDLEAQHAIFLFHPRSLYLSKKVHEHLDYLFWWQPNVQALWPHYNSYVFTLYRDMGLTVGFFLNVMPNLEILAIYKPSHSARELMWSSLHQPSLFALQWQSSSWL